MPANIVFECECGHIFDLSPPAAKMCNCGRAYIIRFKEGEAELVGVDTQDSRMETYTLNIKAHAPGANAGERYD